MGVVTRQRALRAARLAGLGVVVLLAGFLLVDLALPVDLAPRGQARVVVDAAGRPLRAFADADGVWRYDTRPANVSATYLRALIQFEDRWFYHHCGVNPLSLARAGWQWLRHGDIVSGGSTLTMQVARIRYRIKSGVWGKLRQIVRALQLELHFSKNEILTYYLNHAPFGGPLEGVEAASRSYFGYSAATLTQAQAALLAVLPQAPSRYRPDRYPKRAERQRDKVLDRLVRFGVISAAESADAKLESVMADPPRIDMAAPLLARRLTQARPEASLVVSAIDRNIQQALESIARDSLHLIPEQASLAIMAMAHGSGRVVGYVGSADFLDDHRFGHVDMITAQRSPGSTLKPFIYGMAIDQGLIHSQSLLMDVPLQFGDYRPRNFRRGFSGPVSASHALKKSLNLPAVQLLDQVGAERFYARMQTAGADLHLPRGGAPNLAMALGGVAIDLEHLMRLYSALANNGDTLAPRLTPTEPLRRRKLLSPGAAWIVRDMLTRRYGDEDGVLGLAIKTGTTFGARDAWAMALGDHYTVGVWVGRPDNAAMVGHFGNFTAVPIARSVMAVLPPTEHTSHPRPASVTSQEICWPGGQPADHRCDERKTAWILDATLPRTLMSTTDRAPLIPIPEVRLRIATDTGLRVPMGCAAPSRNITVPVWPAPLQGWIQKEFRNSHRIPGLDPRCTLDDGLLVESPVQIVGLNSNDRIRSHATTRAHPVLRAEAVGGQPEWYWFLNGALLDNTGSHLKLPLPRPGRYQLVVTDQAGMSDAVSFVIE